MLTSHSRDPIPGRIDASLKLESSILRPTIGGKIALSRGVAVLAAPAAHPDAPPMPAQPAATPPAERDLVAKAFAVLTQKGGITRQIPALDMLSQVHSWARPVHPVQKQFPVLFRDCKADANRSCELLLSEWGSLAVLHSACCCLIPLAHGVTTQPRPCESAGGKA